MAYTESSTVSRFSVLSFQTEMEAKAFILGIEVGKNDPAFKAQAPVYRRGQWHVRVDDKVVDEITTGEGK